MKSAAWLVVAALALGGCRLHSENDVTATLPNYALGAPSPTDVRLENGDRLNLALGANPTNLVPFLSGEDAGMEIAGHLYQSLLDYDANLNLRGQLASTWAVSDGGRTITFTLKKGLVFSDGSPLTSADVLATFRAIIDPNTRTPYAGDYLLVTKAEAPDPLTFRVSYAEPFAPALASWAGLAVLPAKEIAKTKDFNTTALKEKPLGSGDYTLTRWRRGQDILLTANSRTTVVPHISQLFYRILPDSSAQWLALKAGQLDMASLTPLQFSRLTDGHKNPWFGRQYQKYSWLSNSYTFLGFNLKRPLFQDKKLRQALAYAVDRQGIVNAVLFGQGQPMAGIFKPGTWAYNPALKPWPYNPQKAAGMLDTLGWKKGPDGLRYKNGVPLEFTVATNQANEVRMRAAQILQKNFADLGVTMHIRVQEWSSFITNTIKHRDFDAVLLGWGLSAEPDPNDIWNSKKTKPDEFNMIGYANPQADVLMEKARRTFDQKERQKYLWQLQDILSDDQPYLWLYCPNSLLAVHRRIQGIKVGVNGISADQEDWYVPKEWRLRNGLQQ